MVPRAVTSLRFGRLDMHVLVCLSAVGAAAIGQWAEAAAVAFLFAIAHLMEAWSIERARHAVSTLVGHEPGWGDDGGHEAAPVERWIERFAAVYTPVVTLRGDCRGARAAAARRWPVGRVVLSRLDLPRPRVPMRAGDLHAGHGGCGADVRGPARRAVQGRRAARACRRAEVSRRCRRCRRPVSRAMPNPPSPRPRRAGPDRRAHRRRADRAITTRTSPFSSATRSARCG